MPSPLYLISGATGSTGQAAVSALRDAGASVRALVRQEDERSHTLERQGMEIAIGDLLDLDQVRAALEGVAGAYFLYPIRPGLIDAAAIFAQAAIEAGVKSIVNMSQKSARREAKSHAARNHWLAERIFDWSGVPTTHLRPTFFAEWLTYPMAAFNVKEGVLAFPFADGRHAPIAAQDQGRVVAALLQDPEPHAGKVYPLYGPVEFNHGQIAEKLTDVLGRPFVYRPISIPDFAHNVEASGMSPYFVQHISAVAQDYRDGVFAGTNTVVQDLTGRKPLTLEDFIVSHRAKFER